jgi:hypothetical protein
MVLTESERGRHAFIEHEKSKGRDFFFTSLLATIAGVPDAPNSGHVVARRAMQAFVGGRLTIGSLQMKPVRLPVPVPTRTWAPVMQNPADQHAMDRAFEARYQQALADHAVKGPYLFRPLMALNTDPDYERGLANMVYEIKMLVPDPPAGPPGAVHPSKWGEGDPDMTESGFELFVREVLEMCTARNSRIASQYTEDCARVARQIHEEEAERKREDAKAAKEIQTKTWTDAEVLAYAELAREEHMPKCSFPIHNLVCAKHMGDIAKSVLKLSLPSSNGMLPKACKPYTEIGLGGAPIQYKAELRPNKDSNGAASYVEELVEVGHDVRSTKAQLTRMAVYADTRRWCYTVLALATGKVFAGCMTRTTAH